MALTFDHAAKLIGVPQADAAPVLIQTLLNAIRTEEASERGITHDQIADASGKEVLGPGVATGITLALRSTWKLDFEAGAYQATVDGGNVADALARVNNTGSPQVVMRSSVATTLAASDGSTAPTEGQIAAAVWAYFGRTLTGMPQVDVRRINGGDVIGDGTAGNPWRGVGVPP